MLDLPRPGVWLLAIRPRTLIVSVAPVLLGLALAARQSSFEIGVAVATLLTAVLLQIVANLANDYADAQTGVDDENRLGPVRVTQSGLIAPATVQRAMLAALTTAALCGIVLLRQGGWPIALLGIAAMLAAVGYSVGRKPLSWLGLGELLAFLFFGPVAVAGTAYLQTGRVDPVFFLASLPLGFMAAALMLVNNIRDLESDRNAGKRTIAVRFGTRAARSLYAVLMGLSFIAIAVLAGTTGWATLLAFLTAPAAVIETRKVQVRTGPALNSSLARTAMLAGVTGMLLALGVLW